MWLSSDHETWGEVGQESPGKHYLAPKEQEGVPSLPQDIILSRCVSETTVAKSPGDPKRYYPKDKANMLSMWHRRIEIRVTDVTKVLDILLGNKNKFPFMLSVISLGFSVTCSQNHPRWRDKKSIKIPRSPVNTLCTLKRCFLIRKLPTTEERALCWWQRTLSPRSKRKNVAL